MTISTAERSTEINAACVLNIRFHPKKSYSCYRIILFAEIHLLSKQILFIRIGEYNVYKFINPDDFHRTNKVNKLLRQNNVLSFPYAVRSSNLICDEMKVVRIQYNFCKY